MNACPTISSGLADVLIASPLPQLRRLVVTESEAEVVITGRVSSYYMKQLAQSAPTHGWRPPTPQPRGSLPELVRQYREAQGPAAARKRLLGLRYLNDQLQGEVRPGIHACPAAAAHQVAGTR